MDIRKIYSGTEKTILNKNSKYNCYEIIKLITVTNNKYDKFIRITRLDNYPIVINVNID